ncbi:MAG: cohesin domain-containing protein [bacterium]|nr:cohesin domain-containing protein [bacterium]
MKNIHKILLLVLGLALVVSVSLKTPVFVFSPAKAELKSKETITTGVVLRGKESLLKKVAVIDIKVEYDRSKLKLISAEPGTFFPVPLKAKWDEENAVFSLATLLKGENRIILNSQKEGEIIKLVFQVRESTGKTKISFAKATSAYLLEKGKLKARFADAVYVIVK